MRLPCGFILCLTDCGYAVTMYIYAMVMCACFASAAA